MEGAYFGDFGESTKVASGDCVVNAAPGTRESQKAGGSGLIQWGQRPLAPAPPVIYAEARLTHRPIHIGFTYAAHERRARETADH